MLYGASENIIHSKVNQYGRHYKCDSWNHYPVDNNLHCSCIEQLEIKIKCLVAICFEHQKYNVVSNLLRKYRHLLGITFFPYYIPPKNSCSYAVTCFFNLNTRCSKFQFSFFYIEELKRV